LTCEQWPNYTWGNLFVVSNNNPHKTAIPPIIILRCCP